MAVGRYPLAIFFIVGLNDDERGSLINHCLLKLHNIGVVISSVTCDGHSCNFAIFASLGVELKPPDIEAYFPHPADSSSKVFMVLDACHMLKFVRNCLASYGVLKDWNGIK